MRKIFFLLATVCMMLVACTDAHTPPASGTTASQQTTTGITTVLQNPTTAFSTSITTENVPVTTTPQTDPPVTQLPFSAEVEAALRLVLEKPEGELTAPLLETVTELTITFEIDAEEQSLKGLELCPALRVLVINNYCGDSLEFLRNVPSLEMLSLDWWDSMTPEIVYDLTPLSSLAFLKHLEFDGYPMPDLTVIGTLTGLEELWLHRCGISDLAPLAALTNLTGLSLGHYTAHGAANSVTNLSPLTALSKLEYLHLVYVNGSLEPIKSLPIRSLVISQCEFDSYEYLPETVESLLIDTSGFEDSDLHFLKQSDTLRYLILGDQLENPSALQELPLEGYAYAFDETVANKEHFTGYYNQLLVQKSMLCVQ